MSTQHNGTSHASNHHHHHHHGGHHKHRVYKGTARKEFHYKLYKNPPETVTAIVEASVKKAIRPWHKQFVLGTMAGIYIGLAGALSFSVAGGVNMSLLPAFPILPKLLVALTFPIALVLVVLMGAELFTGNVMYMINGVLARKVTIGQWWLNWLLIFVGNWVGCTIMALASWGMDMFPATKYDGTPTSYPTFLLESVLVAKMSPSGNWGVTLLKAIPANILVCCAMFFAQVAEDATGKILGIWIPIFAFVASGFEHVVANMYFLTVALLFGSSTFNTTNSYGYVFSWGDFVWRNILPSTIGNIIGGGLFVAVVSWYAFTVPPPAPPPQSAQDGPADTKVNLP